MSEICPHAKRKLEVAVVVGRKKERKKEKRKICRTIEDGLGNAFDSKWFYVS